MIQQYDNKGTFNISKDWSMRGRTHHVGVQMYMLQDLNKQKQYKWNW